MTKNRLLRLGRGVAAVAAGLALSTAGGCGQSATHRSAPPTSDRSTTQPQAAATRPTMATTATTATPGTTATAGTAPTPPTSVSPATAGTTGTTTTTTANRNRSPAAPGGTTPTGPSTSLKPPTTATGGGAATSPLVPHGTGPQGTTSPPASTTTAPIPRSSPEVAAAQANVTPADLPAGWVGDVPGTGLAQSVLACLAPVGVKGHVSAQATGPRSSLGTPDNQVRAVSVTLVFDSPEAAVQAATAASAPAFGACATPLIGAVAGLSSVSGGPLQPRSGLPQRGQQSVWFRGALATADPVDPGATVKVDALLSVIRTDRTVTALVLVDVGGLVNQWMIDDLSQAVAAHQLA